MIPVNPLIHPRPICVEKISSFKITRIRVEEALDGRNSLYFNHRNKA